jgi:hypothetical protein
VTSCIFYINIPSSGSVIPLLGQTVLFRCETKPMQEELLGYWER